MTRQTPWRLVAALGGALVLILLLQINAGGLATLVLLALGAAAAVLLARSWRRARKYQEGAWRPTVQHHELPPPPEDPVIGWVAPPADSFATPTPPLENQPLSALVRGQLDSFALGRAKRILEAPALEQHAAADPEAWDCVSAAVSRAVELAVARKVEFTPNGQRRLAKALVLCAAQGVLLAEWRQLEDGKTVWDGDTPRVRASDVFTIQRIAEVMGRRVLSDFFAVFQRKPPDFHQGILVPYTISLAFSLRLKGNPPKAFAA